MNDDDSKRSDEIRVETPFEEELVEHVDYPEWFHEKFTAEQDCLDPEACGIPDTCKITKECVKTYKCHYKLYKISHYHLCMICPHCGHEFDYYYYQGLCPRCY
jgi:hypothetical protein